MDEGGIGISNEPVIRIELGNIRSLVLPYSALTAITPYFDTV